MKKALVVFVKDALSCTPKTIINPTECSKFVFYSNAIPTNDEWQKNGFYPCLQRGGDVGERMLNASLHVFSKRFDKVILAGNYLNIVQEHIDIAFQKLEHNDVVIAPSKSNGYNLLGMKKLYPYLFFNKSWHTNKVLTETLEEIERHQLNVSMLGRGEMIKNIQPEYKSTAS